MVVAPAAPRAVRGRPRIWSRRPWWREYGGRFSLRTKLTGDGAPGAGSLAGTGAGGAAVVTPRAQYSYGVQLGARPKAAPDYIGATNRASRRRARLAELDRLIADLSRQREDLAAQRERVPDLLADLGRAAGAPADRRSRRRSARSRTRRGSDPRRDQLLADLVGYGSDAVRGYGIASVNDGAGSA